jgi:hypothetical protein
MLAWSLKVVEEFNLFCAGAHPLFKPSVPDRTRQRAIQLPFQTGQCVGPISFSHFVFRCFSNDQYLS